MSLAAEHRPQESRFVVALSAQGPFAQLDYEVAGAVCTFTHTIVPPEFRGQGVAAQLVEAGLAWARAQQLRVVPACSYVHTYIQRHREWQDLLS
jgi:predicted GNAT family acetyltransferase